MNIRYTQQQANRLTLLSPSLVVGLCSAILKMGIAKESLIRFECLLLIQVNNIVIG